MRLKSVPFSGRVMTDKKRTSVRYQHVAFDLDGTLLDSENVMMLAWERTVLELGITNNFSEYKKYIGLPFKKIMDSMGLSNVGGVVEKLYFENTSLLADKVVPFEGAFSFIDSLRALEIKFSIITSKPRKNTEKLLSRFPITPDCLICSGDDNVGKPNSEPMQHVRRELSLREDERILYFGDMLSDIVFSINSGVDYCHCNFGIYGQLSKMLLPGYKSIDNWREAEKILIEGVQDVWPT